MPGTVVNHLASVEAPDRRPLIVVPAAEPHARLDRTTRARRLIREPLTMSHWVLGALGAFVVVGLLYTITVQRIGTFPDPYKHLAVTTVLLMAIVYRSAGVYRMVNADAAGLWLLTRAWVGTVALLIAIGLVTDTASAFSWRGIAYWATAALFAQYALSFVAHVAFKLWQVHLRVNLPTVVIGSGPYAAHLVESINRNPLVSEQVVGVLDDTHSASRWEVLGVPLLGGPDDIAEVLARRPIDRAYIALPIERSAKVARLLETLLERNVDVVWCPDIYAFNVLNPGMREIDGIPCISLSESPLITGGRAYLKSLMDTTLALALLIVLSPIMLIAALAVKLTSPGPIFYRQSRHGWDNAVFSVWKFRSMYVHDEGEGCLTQARADDERVTPVGRILRATSIDELPQLFNVLGGTMSLVGPRPHAMVHNDRYSAEIAHYMCRHRIKPGITGLAQIRGHRGNTEAIANMQARVASDIEYINNWSLSLDLWILLKTPYALLKHKGY
jgi:putative colanic acid biosynthesis UDP-glucose lipid carrier transferase